MPVMYSFCFWFSVRLGAIIVGATCLVQATVLFIMCCMAMTDVEGVSEMAHSWLDSYEMMFMKDALSCVEADPNGYLITLLTCICIYSMGCVLLIYGSFKCNVYAIYPFLGLDLARLVFTSVFFVLAMIIIKENVPDLGLIILYSISGGFVLLYMFYTWFCAVSLCQVINELTRGGKLMTSPEEAPPVPRKPLAVVGLGTYPYNHYPITLGRPIF